MHHTYPNRRHEAAPPAITSSDGSPKPNNPYASTAPSTRCAPFLNSLLCQPRFLNIKEGRVLRLTLAEMGHPQPPTPIHCDNATAVDIAKETVKKHRSRPMEMRYFYSCDQVKRGNFDVQWHPGHECLGDYPSKHHITSHHQNVRPIYLHTKESPLLLPKAPKPSDLRGCVGKTLAGYKRVCPLPVLPRIRSLLPRGTQEVPRGGVPIQ